MTQEAVNPLQHQSADLARYSRQSWVTDPGRYTHLYGDLPKNLGEICRVLQGLLVHYRGGIEVTADRLREIDTRRVEPMLARIIELDPSPLSAARQPETRLIGCCRDYAVLLCSVLRQRDIPARVRFGFATYFEPNFLPDHVVTEYWNGDENRWVLVDAELEESEAHRQCFDALDLPRDRFLLAGDVWQRCRRGELDPNRCGVNEEICGLSFVGRYVSHDLAALDRIESLCWDGWGMTDVPPDGVLDEDELALLDAVAATTLEGRTAGYEADQRLRPVGEIRSYSAAGFYTLTLP